MTTARKYYEQWAESGSLRPTLVLGDESNSAVGEVQDCIYDQLAPSSPEITKQIDLHATSFYVRPANLLRYMKRYVNSSISPPVFYNHIRTDAFIASAAIIPADVAVIGLSRFGEHDETIGLELDITDFNEATSSSKELFLSILGNFGLRHYHTKHMSEHPQFMWLVGESTPHVSLVHNIPRTQSIPVSVDVPPVVHFASVHMGSIDMSLRTVQR
jgi:hypothetical protein